MREKLFLKMPRSSTLKDQLCYQRPGSVFCEIFPSKHS